MNFKLSQKAVTSIHVKYSKKIQELANTKWEVSANSCGCTGDCGSNWMRVKKQVNSFTYKKLNH